MKNFLFKAKKGQMEFSSNYGYALFKQCLQESEGKSFRISPLVVTRSLSQNALYWKYLEEIEIETGNNANDLHEFFKREFLPPEFITVKLKGKSIERKIPRSTTDLSKLEFGTYMEKICALTNVPIPDTEIYNLARDLAPMN